MDKINDLEYYDKLERKFPDYEIFVLGSSLGGAISNYIGRTRNARGWAYNAGFGFGSSKRTGRVVIFTETITTDAFSYNTSDDHNIPWQLEVQHQYRAPRTFTLSNNGIVVLSVENYDTSALDNYQETDIFSFQ